MTATLSGRTILMSGGSRGIGLAIAERAARDGANVAILAKTDQPHPTLEGTVHTAAQAIEAAGGRALPIVGDVRDEDSVRDAVAATVERFGGIDIVVNNASAIDLSSTQDLSMKRYDLMQDINCRGSFLLAKADIPLEKTWGDVGKHDRNRLVDLLTNDRYVVAGKTTFKEEFVTAGGVTLEEVDPNTLQSLKVPGLYFAGEVLDIDGITGGFNFQAAWTTGYLAGRLG